MRVLFVEDEPALTQAAVPVLRAGGFTVDEVVTLSEAYAAHETCAYDAILLDRHLPDGDGISLLKDLRRARNATPIILMSAAMSRPRDRIDGLEFGADDYLSKPMDLAELVARLKSVLRRPALIEHEVIEIGNLKFDTTERQAYVDDRHIAVARREIDFLECLIRARGRVVGRERIEESMYGFDDDVSVNAIDVSMHRLRKLLKNAGATARIETVRGIGYALRAMPEVEHVVKHAG